MLINAVTIAQDLPMEKLLFRKRVQEAVRKACPRTNGEAWGKRTVSDS